MTVVETPSYPVSDPPSGSRTEWQILRELRGVDRHEREGNVVIEHRLAGSHRH